MKIEIRADGAHISGYVNVTGKRSRPVITPHGKVIEEIEPRAFEQAIGRAGNITSRSITTTAMYTLARMTARSRCSRTTLVCMPTCL